MSYTAPRNSSRRRNGPRIVFTICAALAVAAVLASGLMTVPVAHASGSGALGAPIGTPPTGDPYNPTHWKAVAGDTITDTIFGATDAVAGTNGCTPLGQTPRVAVLIKSSTFGNTQVCGTLSGNDITFQWTVQAPDPSTGVCNTSIVAYATGHGFTNTNNSLITPGGGSSAGFAMVDSTGTLIEVCGDGPPPSECVIEAPPNSDLGCNPTTAQITATCDSASAHVTGAIKDPPGIQCSQSEITNDGCKYSVTNTYTATASGDGGLECSDTQTITWTVDTTPPTLVNVPIGSDLGCNPTTLPTCATNVTATDGCDGTAPLVTCTAGEVKGSDCAKSQTFTYSTKDTCGNPASQDVTYTWKIDTTPPVLTVPGDVTVECDAVPAVGNASANDNCDGAITATYKGETRTNGNCPNNYTLTRTWTAIDSCGNPSTKSQIITVHDTTAPVIGNAGANATISCPAVPVFTPPTATDNCGTATVNTTGPDVIVHGLNGTYTVTRTWDAVDACGNHSGTKSQTITVKECIAAGGLTIGFWQNKNGQGIITGGAATVGVCNSGTFLRTYAPFQDLSATANCAAVGTYVTNIIKAANASGAAMNAMLKAQMLATALDVYFSNPGQGGNKIGAPAPVGGLDIDLTAICKMIDGTGGTATCSGVYQNVSAAFGGAQHLTVLNILAYAASQSNAGGTAWYGQVKATQELAKNTFDAINNQVAFIWGGP